MLLRGPETMKPSSKDVLFFSFLTALESTVLGSANRNPPFLLSSSNFTSISSPTEYFQQRRVAVLSQLKGCKMQAAILVLSCFKLTTRQLSLLSSTKAFWVTDLSTFSFLDLTSASLSLRSRIFFSVSQSSTMHSNS